MKSRGVHQLHAVLLLAVAARCVQVQERGVMTSSERSTIERTYELTKYLDHQLKEIKDTYLSYLGPPFSDPGFSPPRPNISSLAVPSAATRVDLWRGLENGARLAQNQRAYSVLLDAVRELARSTLCPYLQSSLLHFCSGLSGLLGSISGLMNALGYTPPLHGNALSAQKYGAPVAAYQRANVNGPAPLRRSGQSGSGAGARDGTAGPETERRRDRERERAERGRRGRRRDGETWVDREEQERDEGLERWGRRRRTLSLDEEDDAKPAGYDQNNNNNNNNVNHTHTKDEDDGYQKGVPVLFSSPDFRPGRSGRPVSSPDSPLSPLSLLYAYEDGAVEGDAHFSTSAPSSRPVLNDFTRKVEGFWVLRELQSWLWRSAKDFTRLKKRLRH
ncbi:uncharacterized protein clcf1 [Trichomycterus rosablanca]|uniref:uncharacterized protein clcf1 n=1 Tax=Trichomycterus rosablanca TaxID=2290929 RepID=UPI002F352450